MDVTQENILQVWRVWFCIDQDKYININCRLRWGGSLKGEISIQIMQTAGLKDEITGMVLKYLLPSIREGVTKIKCKRLGQCSR